MTDKVIGVKKARKLRWIRKKTLYTLVLNKFQYIDKAIQELYKRVDNVKGDIKADLFLKELDNGIWNMIISVNDDHHVDLKGHLNLVLDNIQIFKRIYDFEKNTEPKCDNCKFNYNITKQYCDDFCFNGDKYEPREKPSESKIQTISEACKDLDEYVEKINIERKKRNEEDYGELEMRENVSICETCWKDFIWACPLLLHHPKNIILCSAYEPTAVYLKEQELNLKFVKNLDYIMERINFHTENPDSELMDEVAKIYKEYKNKERIIK